MLCFWICFGICTYFLLCYLDILCPCGSLCSTLSLFSLHHGESSLFRKKHASSLTQWVISIFKTLHIFLLTSHSADHHEHLLSLALCVSFYLYHFYLDIAILMEAILTSPHSNVCGATSSLLALIIVSVSHNICLWCVKFTFQAIRYQWRRRRQRK